jgi:hypothetical protein
VAAFTSQYNSPGNHPLKSALESFQKGRDIVAFIAQWRGNVQVDA